MLRNGSKLQSVEQEEEKNMDPYYVTFVVMIIIEYTLKNVNRPCSYMYITTTTWVTFS
jgi:hypothetical protein